MRETMSRRTAIESLLAAAVGVPISASAHAATAVSPRAEAIIRQYYAAWEQPDWQPFDVLLANNFSFTSAAGDDHLSKSAFKAQCWMTQRDFIERFDLLRVFGRGDEAFVMYVCHTKNSKTLQNVEYLRLTDEKVVAIECYFGAQSSFPSAVSAKQG
jgi:ketosteroid isomerase-like protein